MPLIDEVILSCAPGESRLALLAAGQTVELIVDRGDGAAGDLVLGRVLSVNRHLGAAFVDIGEPQAGFLPSPGRLSEGQAVLVQLTQAAHGGKGATVTAKPSLSGRLLAYSPERPGLNLSRRIADAAARDRLTAILAPLIEPEEGVVVRTAAASASAEDLGGELEGLRERWQAIGAEAGHMTPPYRLHAPPPLARVLADHPGVARVRVDDPASLGEARVLFPAARLDRDGFDSAGADEALQQALERRVPLPGGGALIIDELAGLAVIDIDSGGGSAEEANLAAMAEIARQLRLRALGGHIVIDVIPMRDRRAGGRVVEHLRRAVADDPTPTQIVGTTALGLVELTRERRRPSLAELMLEAPVRQPTAETIGLDGLRALLRAAMASPAKRFRLAAAPAVIAALRRRPAALAEAARRLGQPPVLGEDSRVDGFDIVEERG
jgi:ribonuclease G